MATKLITYVALLRGINVGGKSIVSMSRLKACFEELGFMDVKTYINSGNAIFRSAGKDTRVIETQIEKSLAAKFGFPISVVVRNFSEMEKLIRQIPESWRGNTHQKCNVIYLRHTIDNQEALKDLQPKPGIEELRYYPGFLLWSAKTSDLTKSNMIKVSQLGIYKEMTIRNLNTTQKIYGLMRQANGLS